MGKYFKSKSKDIKKIPHKPWDIIFDEVSAKISGRVSTVDLNKPVKTPDYVVDFIRMLG